MDDQGPQLDRETAAALRPADHKAELRLWLRMLTCATLIENGVRRRLRDEFGFTLPRFDLMAQLDKTPQGLTLGELSRRMMVTNGNVTAVVEALAAQGLVNRAPSPTDRRALVATLTPSGRAVFRRMAAAHERWMAEAFAGLSAADIAALMELLGRTKASARRAFEGGRS